jgi:hypothetical protein
MPRNPSGTPALHHAVLKLARERRGGAELVRGEADSRDLGVDAVRITDQGAFLQEVRGLRERGKYSDEFPLRAWLRRHFRFVVSKTNTMQGVVMVPHAAADTCHRLWGVQVDSQENKREKWQRVRWVVREAS